jgi:hypothetical protein
VLDEHPGLWWVPTIWDQFPPRRVGLGAIDAIPEEHAETMMVALDMALEGKTQLEVREALGVPFVIYKSIYRGFEPYAVAYNRETDAMNPATAQGEDLERLAALLRVNRDVKAGELVATEMFDVDI